MLHLNGNKEMSSDFNKKIKKKKKIKMILDQNGRTKQKKFGRTFSEKKKKKKKKKSKWKEKR